MISFRAAMRTCPSLVSWYSATPNKKSGKPVDHASGLSEREWYVPTPEEISSDPSIYEEMVFNANLLRERSKETLGKAQKLAKVFFRD